MDSKQARFEAALSVVANAPTGLTKDEFNTELEDEIERVMASYQSKDNAYHQEVKDYQFRVDDYAKNPAYREKFQGIPPEPPKPITFDKEQARLLVKLLSDIVEEL